MRVFLRNTKTRLYCADSNGWAAVWGQARDFTSVPHAVRFALDGDLPDIEIVLRYEMLPDEVALPLLPEWCDYYQADSAAA